MRARASSVAQKNPAASAAGLIELLLGEAVRYPVWKRLDRFQVSQISPHAIPAGGIASAIIPRFSDPIARSFWKPAVSRHMEQP